MEQDRLDDFTRGSIPRKLFHFMLPILGALVLQAMYGAVDVFVVGRFGTVPGLSGVSTGSNVMNLVTFIVSGFAMGITVLISQYIGAANRHKIADVIGGAFAFFMVWTLLLFIVLVVFARDIALIMQTPKEAMEETISYIRICGSGILFIIAYNVLSAIFRGLGDSRSPLLFVAVACVVNIFGDLLLVAGFGLNATGAALATVLAQAVSVAAALYIGHLKKIPVIPSRKTFRFNEEVPRFTRIGMPIAFQEMLTQLSFMAIVAFINRLGLEASSGYGVANKIVAFVMLIPGSLMQSMSSFVAQNVGAGLEQRAKKAMVTGMEMGFCAGIFVFILVYFFGNRGAALFTTDSLVIDRAFSYLRGFAPETMVTPLLFSFMGYFNGHQKTFFVMSQGIAQTFIVRLPVSYYMSIQPDTTLQAIGTAAPLATIFGILINMVYFKSKFSKEEC